MPWQTHEVTLATVLRPTAQQAACAAIAGRPSSSPSSRCALTPIPAAPTAVEGGPGMGDHALQHLVNDV
jgi:hypothetical protein